MKFRFGNGDQPLSGFTIKRGVGVGGFGEVYFAISDAGKEVALKQIQRNLDVEVRGVRHCMNLKHPNLIALYDIKFDAEEQGWIVMEYVAGPNLRDTLDQHPRGLPVQDLERWFGQIVAGVAYLHDHGIVHRDLKPANIFEDEGIVKIGDYGLSKFISCSRRGGQTESVGTFHYMAPEIGKGEYGREIDIYALGVMLYELATGTVPFDGESSQEIIMKHLTADPDLSLMPMHLRSVVARAMAKNPSARFSDVRQMVEPMGWEVDDRYLLVRSFNNNTSNNNAPPVVPQEPPVHAHRAPFVQRAERNAPPNARSSLLGSEDTSKLYYQEPIARNLQRGWLGLNRWWGDLSINSGMKTTILVLSIIFLAFNTGTVLSILVLGTIFYIPYYAIWWTLRGPQTSPSRRRATRFDQPIARAKFATLAETVARPEDPSRYRPQPVVPQPAMVRSPVRRPLSKQQWRVAKRAQLAGLGRRQAWSDMTGSWLGAACVIGVFSVLVGLFQIGSGKAGQPHLVGMCWAALVTLATSWIAIYFGKRWQREEGDWAIRAFTQLTSGFVIGAFAFGLSEFLMVPWPSIVGKNLGELPVQRWSGFFASDGTPLLPAYLAYFPLMMGAIAWWKQADPLRWTRFSFWPVISSVVLASLVHLLIPFPQPWTALVAAGASIATQLSTPWINPAERLDEASAA